MEYQGDRVEAGTDDGAAVTVIGDILGEERER